MNLLMESDAIYANVMHEFSVALFRTLVDVMES